MSKPSKRSAWTCGVCGTDLQPLDDTTGWHKMAVDLLASWDLVATPALLALASHVSVVHDELEDVPGLQ